MKKYFVFVSMMLFCQSVLAGIDSKQLFVNVALQYQEFHDKGVNRYLIKDILKMAVSNHQWTPIQNKYNNSADRLLLLGKIEKTEANAMTMKFLLLDTRDHAKVLSAPTIVMPYGKSAQMVIGEEKQKIQLTVLASEA